MTKDDILAALPKLNKADLEAVTNMARSLLGAHTGAASQVPPAVFDALVKALGRAILGPQNLPHGLVTQFSTRSKWLTDWLDEEFDGWRGNTLTEKAFLTMLFELLIRDLHTRKIKPTIGTVITNMVRIPHVLDKAFPNYVQCGMSYLILKPFLQVSK